MTVSAAMQAAEAALNELPVEIRFTAILAGGAIRSSFDGTTVKDYDLFFRSDEDFVNAVAALAFADGWQTLPSPTPGRHHTFRSPQGREMNVVGIAFGTPREHMDRFDFRCCAMAAWFDLKGHISFDADTAAIKDAEARRVVIRNNNGDERTIARLRRYELYGYTYAEADDPGDTRFPVGTYEMLLRQRISRLPRSSHGY